MIKDNKLKYLILYLESLKCDNYKLIIYLSNKLHINLYGRTICNVNYSLNTSLLDIYNSNSVDETLSPKYYLSESDVECVKIAIELIRNNKNLCFEDLQKFKILDTSDPIELFNSYTSLFNSCYTKENTEFSKECYVQHELIQDFFKPKKLN